MAAYVVAGNKDLFWFLTLAANSDAPTEVRIAEFNRSTAQ